MTTKPALSVEETPQQDSTELEPVFEPTPKMLKWFDTAVQLGHTATITEIAEKSELDRTTWYFWLRDPKFVEWWDAEWGRYLKANRWKLDAIGMRQAERNYDYWKTMMERTGNISQQPTFNGNFMKIDFTGDESKTS